MVIFHGDLTMDVTKKNPPELRPISISTVVALLFIKDDANNTVK